MLRGSGAVTDPESIGDEQRSAVAIRPGSLMRIGRQLGKARGRLAERGGQD